jgi:hypothetical protein
VSSCLRGKLGPTQRWRPAQLASTRKLAPTEVLKNCPQGSQNIYGKKQVKIQLISTESRVIYFAETILQVPAEPLFTTLHKYGADQLKNDQLFPTRFFLCRYIATKISMVVGIIRVDEINRIDGKIFSSMQGDQIRRIFDYSGFVYFGQFLENYRK